MKTYSLEYLLTPIRVGETKDTFLPGTLFAQDFDTPDEERFILIGDRRDQTLGMLQAGDLSVVLGIDDICWIHSEFTRIA